ncbi:4Fe-4S dicluster domain-containing protein [Blattabacterium cuenoti]|uniref:4Fe-4S dicluster domain-containing protein n=1 Tax=Blattabacterium cuenoti TaxID=1653831 RepID=UPI00163D34EB|nr:4Fe-4S dicluster domain-containing protein [Blattabacterium cuenoti]
MKSNQNIICCSSTDASDSVDNRGEIPVKVFLQKKTSRRDFLKWIGFSTASVTLAACKGPVIKSIPYIVKPDAITPGIPNYYASTMIDSFDMGSVLVKTREGRPIKIEPNLTSKYFNTTSSRIQSSILSLYDEERLKSPFINGKKCSWNQVDDYVIQHLKKISLLKKEIVFLSSSFPSFSTKKLIQDFTKMYPTTQWITYDAISYSKALDATEEILGYRGFPVFDLSKIELIVSFDADFLGDWCPENMGRAYAKARIPDKYMMKHIQIESNMTLSGANADIRISKKPSEIKKMLFEVYQQLFLGIESNDEYVKKIAFLIKKKGSKSVIFADGDKESYIQSLLINQKINSNALQEKFFFSKESNDEKFKKFIEDLEKDKVGALFIHNTNPIYSLPFPDNNKVKKLLKKIPLTVSFSMKKDETNEVINVLASIPHWLESWGDTHPVTGVYTLIQPAIQRIFNTRQFQESLIIWGKIQEKNYYDYLKKTWEQEIIPKSNVSSFNEALFHGVIEIKENITFKKTSTSNNYYNYGDKKLTNYEKKLEKYFELRLYTKTSMGDGHQYNNPWLQELPDPITRATWDNYLTISSDDAKKIGLENWYTGSGAMNGNCVDLIKNNKTLIKDLPIYIQPGQAIGSVGLAFGYGQIEKFSKICCSHNNGKNAYIVYENFDLVQRNIQIKKVNKIHKFACVQLQNTTVGRNLAKETDLETFLKKPIEFWNEQEKISTHKGMISPNQISIWEDKSHEKEKKGHHFNLSIDLNACIGCGSCVISCHSENNVPVVGKEEIRKSRDMHWIRVDRYYSSSEKVSFQPILCQHCDYAPCETVCPVGATVHGEQGQNMMAYNRCVGTRYCANNCPYKVRRFNWFDYANNHKFDFNMNNTLGKMSLNPDVVVRTRGVMEKCSLCIQRTQYTIGIAKKENRKIKDEEFETACSISCPTDAIVFGDINNKNSHISRKIKDSRSYKLLDFIGIRPNVSYQLKIRNKNLK